MCWLNWIKSECSIIYVNVVRCYCRFKTALAYSISNIKFNIELRNVSFSYIKKNQTNMEQYYHDFFGRILFLIYSLIVMDFNVFIEKFATRSACIEWGLIFEVNYTYYRTALINLLYVLYTYVCNKTQHGYTYILY